MTTTVSDKAFSVDVARKIEFGGLDSVLPAAMTRNRMSLMKPNPGRTEPPGLGSMQFEKVLDHGTAADQSFASDDIWRVVD